MATSIRTTTTTTTTTVTITVTEHPHREIEVHQSIFAANDRQAERNRGFFSALNLLVLNAVSSPGSGKTTLLVKTIERLSPALPDRRRRRQISRRTTTRGGSGRRARPWSRSRQGPSAISTPRWSRRPPRACRSGSSTSSSSRTSGISSAPPSSTSGRTSDRPPVRHGGGGQAAQVPAPLPRRRRRPRDEDRPRRAVRVRPRRSPRKSPAGEPEGTGLRALGEDRRGDGRLVRLPEGVARRRCRVTLRRPASRRRAEAAARRGRILAGRSPSGGDRDERRAGPTGRSPRQGNPLA